MLRSPSGYLTGLSAGVRGRADGYARSGQPFLLSLHFNAPHWPWSPGRRGGVERLRQAGSGGLAEFRRLKRHLRTVNEDVFVRRSGGVVCERRRNPQGVRYRLPYRSDSASSPGASKAPVRRVGSDRLSRRVARSRVSIQHVHGTPAEQTGLSSPLVGSQSSSKVPCHL